MKQIIKINERPFWVQDLIMSAALLLLISVLVGLGFVLTAMLYFIIK